MGMMIFNTIQVITSVFLSFAVCLFASSAWKKRENISELLGNGVSAFFMVCAIWLIWR